MFRVDQPRSASSLSLSLSGKMGGIAKSSISDVPICFGITDIAL